MDFIDMNESNLWHSFMADVKSPCILNGHQSNLNVATSKEADLPLFDDSNIERIRFIITHL